MRVLRDAGRWEGRKNRQVCSLKTIGVSATCLDYLGNDFYSFNSSVFLSYPSNNETETVQS